MGGTLILGYRYSAILFLAPISCFDQVLEEDPNVNRLVRSRLQSSVFKRHHSPCFYPIAHFATFVQQEDSILLWKSIVSNPLLARTNLVLFLNKIDILKSKLASGIQFGHYIVSYGARPNDYDNASACK